MLDFEKRIKDAFFCARVFMKYKRKPSESTGRFKKRIPKQEN